MKRRQGCVIAVLLVALSAIAQESTLKPTLTDTPLTADQIAVYRAVLAEYLRGSDRVLNLADVTEPIDESDRSCLGGMGASRLEETAPVIHRIDRAVVADTKTVIVSPDRQREAVRQRDPDNLLTNSLQTGQKPTDEQLDTAVQNALNGGLFQLSEIVFDKEHREAVVSYSFVCGGLCGTGNTLLLRKVGPRWKVAKRCGGWVS